MRLIIPLKAPSLNQIYAGTHWTKRKKLADEWHLVVKSIAYENQNWKGILFDKAVISYEIHYKHKRRHDFDNAMYAAKLINDGLVMAGVIPDDDIDHLQCDGFKVLKGQETDQVIIDIRSEL